MIAEVVFGTTEVFGIGLRPRLVDGELADVFVDLWVAGERLGDRDDPVLVGMLARGFADVSASAPARHCLPFVGVDARRIVEEVWARAYGPAVGPDGLAAGMAAHVYVLSEASLSLLDHGWRVVAVRCGTTERILWDRGAGTPIGDVRVPARVVDRVIADLVAWADARA